MPAHCSFKNGSTLASWKRLALDWGHFHRLFLARLAASYWPKNGCLNASDAEILRSGSNASICFKRSKASNKLFCSADLNSTAAAPFFLLLLLLLLLFSCVVSLLSCGAVSFCLPFLPLLLFTSEPSRSPLVCLLLMLLTTTLLGNSSSWNDFPGSPEMAGCVFSTVNREGMSPRDSLQST